MILNPACVSSLIRFRLKPSPQLPITPSPYKLKSYYKNRIWYKVHIILGNYFEHKKEEKLLYLTSMRIAIVWRYAFRLGHF